MISWVVRLLSDAPPRSLAYRDQTGCDVPRLYIEALEEAIAQA